MSTVEKITIALTPQMAAFVRAEVEAGRYASTSEAVREAVREWQERRDTLGYSAAELRALWKEGVESGISTRTLDEVKAEARRRFELTKQSA